MKLKLRLHPDDSDTVEIYRPRVPGKVPFVLWGSFHIDALNGDLRRELEEGENEVFMVVSAGELAA